MSDETTLSDDQLLAQLQADEAGFDLRASDLAKKEQISALQMAARARKKYPNEELLQVSTAKGTFILRCAEPYQYQRFRELATDPSTKLQANEHIVTACLVEPSYEEFVAITQKSPATIDALSLKAVELAGAKSIQEKKLRPRS